MIVCEHVFEFHITDISIVLTFIIEMTVFLSSSPLLDGTKIPTTCIRNGKNEGFTSLKSSDLVVFDGII